MSSIESASTAARMDASSTPAASTTRSQRDAESSRP
jgi:hypothetical protein